MRYRVPAAVLLVAVGLAVGPALASAVVAPSATAADQSVTSPENLLANTTTNGSDTTTDENVTPTLGSKMSAFMQSSAVSAESAVENGMWTAGYKQANTSAKQDAVQRRTESLERRLTRLESRLAAAETESLDVRNPRAAATVSGLAARIHAIEQAINDTDTAARTVGVNTTRLNALRSQAANMSGHQVASMARNLSVGPPADVPRGPQASPGGPNGPAHDAAGGPNDQTPPGKNESAQPTERDTTPSTTNETTPPEQGSASHPGETAPPAKNGTTTGPTGRLDGDDRSAEPTGPDDEANATDERPTDGDAAG